MARQSFSVRTAVLRGVEALPVMVEVSVSQGIPGVTIVGTPDSAVMESRHRVRCACKACEFDWPLAHFTVNLAPSEVRKTGAGFDLPIAIAILACTEQIPTKDLDGCLFVGELGLEGEVSGIRGLVAHEILAEEQGLTLVAPSGMTSIGSGETRTITHLAQLRQGVGQLPVCDHGKPSTYAPEDSTVHADFADVVDQEMAKRAFVIAAAGNHGLLMVGPPGAGKSMMAKRMPGILSPLSESERAEALLIHSVAGQELDAIRGGKRPFRAPHHAISMGGLVGGGRPVRPGEASLAHRGVLFLDELPEFGPSVLQALRQPLEDRSIVISRAKYRVEYPASFMLVASMNPCPCGYYNHPTKECHCTPTIIERYLGKVSGPLMDRFDIQCEILPVGFDAMSSEQQAEKSAVIICIDILCSGFHFFIKQRIVTVFSDSGPVRMIIGCFGCK